MCIFVYLSTQGEYNRRIWHHSKFTGYANWSKKSGAIVKVRTLMDNWYYKIFKTFRISSYEMPICILKKFLVFILSFFLVFTLDVKSWILYFTSNVCFKVMQIDLSV